MLPHLHPASKMAVNNSCLWVFRPFCSFLPHWTGQIWVNNDMAEMIEYDFWGWVIKKNTVTLILVSLNSHSRGSPPPCWKDIQVAHGKSHLESTIGILPTANTNLSGMWVSHCPSRLCSPGKPSVVWMLTRRLLSFVLSSQTMQSNDQLAPSTPPAIPARRNLP